MYPRGPYLSLGVPGLAEGRPSLLVGDRVIVCEPGKVWLIVFKVLAVLQVVMKGLNILRGTFMRYCQQDLLMSLILFRFTVAMF